MEYPKQKNYQQAFNLACAELKTKDPEERASKAGGVYERDPKGETIRMPFFSESYLI